MNSVTMAESVGNALRWLSFVVTLTAATATPWLLGGRSYATHVVVEVIFYVCTQSAAIGSATALVLSRRLHGDSVCWRCNYFQTQTHINNVKFAKDTAGQCPECGAQPRIDNNIVYSRLLSRATTDWIKWIVCTLFLLSSASWGWRWLS